MPNGRDICWFSWRGAIICIIRTLLGKGAENVSYWIHPLLSIASNTTKTRPFSTHLVPATGRLPGFSRLKHHHPWYLDWKSTGNTIPITKSSPLKIGWKGKDRLPTINFQGRAVSFREGILRIRIFRICDMRQKISKCMVSLVLMSH